MNAEISAELDATGETFANVQSDSIYGFILRGNPPAEILLSGHRYQKAIPVKM